MDLVAVTIVSVNAASKDAAQVGATGQALMQSQRLAKSVSQALIGSPQAFPEVRESTEVLSRTVPGRKSGEGDLAAGLACPGDPVEVVAGGEDPYDLAAVDDQDAVDPFPGHRVGRCGDGRRRRQLGPRLLSEDFSDGSLDPFHASPRRLVLDQASSRRRTQDRESARDRALPSPET